ncbi:Polynucleotide 5'-hydroxyl-kinase grc3 [Tulasnella sp. UAMH 9824]|nr:Polynucleotide 5'-hydroxyl-kinase grc3 [Tulasnella sp. UAMH 9824]
MLSAVAARKAAKKAEQEAKAAEKAAEEAVRQQTIQSRTASSTNNAARAGASTHVTLPTERTKKRKTPKEVENDANGMLPNQLKAGTYVNDSDTPKPPTNHDVPQPAKKKHKRAWSPSQLMVSASEEHDDGDEDSDNDAVLDLGPSAVGEASNERFHQIGPTFSTFKPILGQNTFPASFIKSSASSGTLVILKWAQNETIIFTGAVKLTLIVGYLSVFGTEITPGQSHTIFAPTIGPLPTLRHSRSQHAVVSTEIDLDALRALPKEVTEKWRMGDTVIRFESMSETRVEGLGDVVGTCEGMFGGGNGGGPTSDLGIEGFYLVSSPQPGTHTFSAPVQWVDAIEQLVGRRPSVPRLEIPHTVALVRGPKRSGKSTFTRTMTNSMLARYEQVAYLDCDIGQPEFGPPGTVGLYIIEVPNFGLPFTHPRRPLAAHYIGSTSPRSNPSHYISAIASLLQVFRVEVQAGSAPPSGHVDHQESSSCRRNATRLNSTIPLIINTHGWVKGMGADLARRIEELAQPTHIFDLLPRPSDRELDLYGFEGGPSGRSAGERVLLSEVPGATVWGDDATSSSGIQTGEPSKVISLPPGPLPGPGNSLKKAEELRDLAIMSYFHCQLDTSSWRTEVAISAALPYAVDAAEAFDAIILTCPGSEDVVTEELAKALNGSFVALIESDEPKAILQLAEGGVIPYVQGAPPPDPLTSRCLGFGFIRATASRTPTSLQLHIVTPLTPTDVARCRVLVKGEIDMPIWASIGSCSSVEGREWRNGRLYGVGWEETPHLVYRRPQEGGLTSKAAAAAPIGGEVKKGRKNVRRAAQL